jgi:hypothetical protein
MDARPRCEVIKMTKTEKNKLACSWLGIEWHEPKGIGGRLYGYAEYYVCICGINNCQLPNPDFTQNAKDLIEAVKGKEYENSFFAWLMYGDNSAVEAIDDDGLIDRDYILNPEALLDKFLEFMAMRKR